MPKTYLIIILLVALFMNDKGYSQNAKPRTPVQQLFSNVEKVIPNFKNYCKKGLTDEEILQLESKIGCKIPDAVKEFYKTIRPDKINGLAYGWGFISLGYNESSIYDPFLGKFIDNPDKVKTYWNAKTRIPIIEDGGGSTIYLDLDPNTNGKQGQLILIFRDYPEIVFSVAKDFESFIILLNRKFEEKKFTGYVDERENMRLEMKGNSGGSFYENWVSMSHSLSSEIKNNSTELLNLDSLWQKSLNESRNGEFVRKQASDFTKSDTEKIYYILLRDKNLENLEPLALFPKIAKISFFLKDNKTPTRLWKILEKTRITDIDFIVSHDSTTTLDFKNFTKLQSLSNLNLQAGYTPNIDSIALFRNLKYLRVNQIFDLKFLNQMPQLTTLELGKEGNSYQNWEAISSLKELKGLRIPTSNFTDLSILTNLKNLTSLSVGNNEFKDYTVFEKLPSKLWIGCSYNLFEKIFDIAIKKQFTFSSFYGKSTPKQKELYNKYIQIRETWK